MVWDRLVPVGLVMAIFTGAAAGSNQETKRPSEEARCSFGAKTLTDSAALPRGDSPVCPADSLFSQGPDTSDSFMAGTSDGSSAFERWDNFSDVGGAIESVTWWGLDLDATDGGWQECDESDPTFEIRFQDDVAGLPGPDICSFVVTATRTPTGIILDGAEVNEYTASLSSPCIVPRGWISIVGFGDPDCWFLWMSSRAGDGFSLCTGCEPYEQSFDLSICLRGELGGIFGACCDEGLGTCNDGAEITDCLPVGTRFVPDVPCADLDPPCELLSGACCLGQGACFVGVEADCAAQDGTWLGSQTDCSSCPVVGACCQGGTACTIETFEACASEQLNWLGEGSTCDQCPPLPTCPADSIHAQPPHDVLQNWLAGTSEADPGYTRSENFAGVAGAVEALTWWGLDLDYNDVTGQFGECTEFDNTFEIRFLEDAGGVPGESVCSYVLTATRTPTGLLYEGAELNEYQVVLPEPCVLVHGWVSLVGLGDSECWFLWMSGTEGDAVSYCEGCTPPPQTFDPSVCFQGEAGGVYGACCDDPEGTCNDQKVEITSCLDANQRFLENASCDDFDPPCGVVSGACCSEESCSVTEEAECAGTGGFWLGSGSACDQCPCSASCPSTGVPEGEPVCSEGYIDTFNGGCFATQPAFSPIVACESVCAEGGVFETGPDVFLDTDWYELTLDQDTELSWSIEGEFPVRGLIYDGSAGCAGRVLLVTDSGGPCEPFSITASVGPGTYWLVVYATQFNDESACGADYTATLTTSASCPGDLNNDGQVDLLDFEAFQDCFTGPGGGPVEENCTEADFDSDLDVDLVDWGFFQTRFG